MLLHTSLINLLLLVLSTTALSGGLDRHQGKCKGKDGKGKGHSWKIGDHRHHVETEPIFYAGHDLSSLGIMYEGGYIYRDSARNNTIRPAEDILGDGGMNTVRLRLWVDPIEIPYDGGYYEAPGLNYTLELAKSMYDKGYNIYLDYRTYTPTLQPSTHP